MMEKFSLVQNNTIIFEGRAEPGIWSARLDNRRLLPLIEKMSEIIYQNGYKIGTISINIISDRDIAKLNRQFMGCNGPTNVLSFPDPSSNTGSLFISSDTMLREAFLYGLKPEEYFLRLAAHGLCHLAGLDHGPEMEKLQLECEETVGLHLSECL